MFLDNLPPISPMPMFTEEDNELIESLSGSSSQHDASYQQLLTADEGTLDY